jgi:hypothetical protein
MKSILKQIAESNKHNEMNEAAAAKAELSNPSTSADRRHFLKQTAIGGMSLAGPDGIKYQDTLLKQHRT